MIPARRMALSLAISTLCWVANSCGAAGRGSPPCGAETATVAYVVDGDTIDLADGRRVRYLLVDTPEIDTDDCFAANALDLNAALVMGKSVGLEYDVECEDRYGRTLAYVRVSNRLVNSILLERGYARLLVIAPNTHYVDELRLLEAQARATRAGLWGACP